MTSCYQPPRKHLSSAVILKPQPVRGSGTSLHMLTTLEAPACRLAVSTGGGGEGGYHKTRTRTSQLPKFLGPELPPQIIVLDFRSRAYGKREHLLNHGRRGVARGAWPDEGVVRGGRGQQRVWSEEGRGQQRMWSEEGRGLHVRPVISHQHNHSTSF